MTQESYPKANRSDYDTGVYSTLQDAAQIISKTLTDCYHNLDTQKSSNVVFDANLVDMLIRKFSYSLSCIMGRAQADSILHLATDFSNNAVLVNTKRKGEHQGLFAMFLSVRAMLTTLLSDVTEYKTPDAITRIIAEYHANHPWKNGVHDTLEKGRRANWEYVGEFMKSQLPDIQSKINSLVKDNMAQKKERLTSVSSSQANWGTW